MRELASGCRAFLLGIALGGCSGSSPPDEASITGLHFTSSSTLPGNPPLTDVDVTLTDPIPSRAIYRATLALPDFPSGTFNCPADLGYRHTIVFTHDADAAVTATLDVGGCRGATISDAPPVRQTNDAYWTLLAQKLGVDEAMLFEATDP